MCEGSVVAALTLLGSWGEGVDENRDMSKEPNKPKKYGKRRIVRKARRRWPHLRGRSMSPIKKG